MTKFIATPEQQAFASLLREEPHQSVILDAKAGAGKTSALVENLPTLAGQGPVLLMAFNKKIAGELEERVARLAPAVRLATTVGTCHSIGLRSWPKGSKRPRVQGGKLTFLLDDQLAEHRIMDKEHPAWKARSLLRRMVSFAKNAGFGLSSGEVNFPSIRDTWAWQELADHYNLEVELEELGLDLATATKHCIELLERSNDAEGLIDFDDMIYLPLLRRYKLQQYRNVLIDEAQDTNATRQELAFRSLRPDGRIIAVGDPHQAIYGFTGALADALSRIASRANAVTLPLSVCWRCDEAIIRHAQRWVPGIRARPGAAPGTVRSVEFDEQFLDQPAEGDAILCRLNRPNVALAIAFLRRGKKARIEGRDLGQKLLAHAKKASPGAVDLVQLQLDLEPYLAHQVNLLTAHEKQAEAALLQDEVDALHVLIERCQEQHGAKATLEQLRQLCELLFVDEGHKQKCILLSSIHKAKGLEWPRVWLLGRDDYMPFFLASQEWEQEQENNLIYVGVTRARSELIEVTGVQAALDKGLHRQLPAPQGAKGQASQPKPEQALPPEADPEAEHYEDGGPLPSFLQQTVKGL